MRFNRTDCIISIGKAKSGKSTEAIESAAIIPKSRLATLDFIAGDLGVLKSQSSLYHRIEKNILTEAKEFIRFCYNHGDLFIVMDECENYLTDENDLAELFNTTARNRGLGYNGICKRPQNLGTFIRERANYLKLFNQSEPNGIAVTARWIGRPVKEVDKNIRSLKNGEHFIYDLDDSQMSGKLKCNLQTHKIEVVGQWQS
jgi:hypothetical protein